MSLFSKEAVKTWWFPLPPPQHLFWLVLASTSLEIILGKAEINKYGTWGFTAGWERRNLVKGFVLGAVRTIGLCQSIVWSEKCRLSPDWLFWYVRWSMRVLFHTFVLKGNNIHLETVKGSVCLLGLVNGNAFFSLFHLQRRWYFLGKKKKQH